MEPRLSMNPVTLTARVIVLCAASILLVAYRRRFSGTCVNPVYATSICDGERTIISEAPSVHLDVSADPHFLVVVERCG